MKEEFLHLESGTIFRIGILPNSPEGLFMTTQGGELMWIAIKGFANDWTIYCHWKSSSIEYIRKHGDKIARREHILRCIPECGDIIDAYRY